MGLGDSTARGEKVLEESAYYQPAEQNCSKLRQRALSSLTNKESHQAGKKRVA